MRLRESSDQLQIYRFCISDIFSRQAHLYRKCLLNSIPDISIWFEARQPKTPRRSSNKGNLHRYRHIYQNPRPDDTRIACARVHQ